MDTSSIKFRNARYDWARRQEVYAFAYELESAYQAVDFTPESVERLAKAHKAFLECEKPIGFTQRSIDSVRSETTLALYKEFKRFAKDFEANTVAVMYEEPEQAFWLIATNYGYSMTTPQEARKSFEDFVSKASVLVALMSENHHRERLEALLASDLFS